MNEIMAMLTPKTASWIPSGGAGEVTPQMVAAACAGLPPYCWLYVMCKSKIDTSLALDLQKAALEHAKIFAEAKGWRVSKKDPPDIIYKLSDMALESALKDKLCLGCCGAKLNSQMRKCGLCGGTGLAPAPSEASRARSAGVTIESWNRRWKRRFAALAAEYDILEAHVAWHVRRRLRGDDDS